MAWTDTAAEFVRRQGEARQHDQEGAARPATVVDLRGGHRGEWALRKSAQPGSWLTSMLARKPRLVVAVALANRIARVAWALLAKGGVYRVSSAVPA